MRLSTFSAFRRDLEHSEPHGMSTLFRGITKTVPSLFRGIFSERNSDGNFNSDLFSHSDTERYGTDPHSAHNCILYFTMILYQIDPVQY
jgi:hypothetical protein